MLDEEFIYSKGRRISLRSRHPQIFNKENIYVASTGWRVDGCVVTHPFGWIADGQLWHGMMIGMVCVRPECRGRGIGTRLMREVVADSQADFGVLWTTIPDFYTGWQAADTGLFGKAKPGDYNVSGRVVAHTVGYCDQNWLNRLRHKYTDSRVIRTSWAMKPIPAEHILLYTVEDEGYALVGRMGNTGYVYDFIGTPESYPLLWSTVCEWYDVVYVNTHRNDPALSYLVDKVDLERQNLAMWLPLSNTAKAAHYTKWYIPYFDRI